MQDKTLSALIREAKRTALADFLDSSALCEKTVAA